MDKHEILNELLVTIENIYGIYNDGVNGFHLNLKQLNDSQKETIKGHNFTIEHLDTLPYVYGIGNPNFVDAEILHESTQGSYKIRNQRGGSNSVTLGNLCLTQIDLYWTDHYREQLAKCIGKTKNDINSEIFADIRRYRNSIIHHQSIAIGAVAKNNELKWFKPDEPIIINEEKMKELINIIRGEIKRLNKVY